MIVYNIIIVGSGELGSRHLQSLAKSKVPIKIWVIDINEKSLEIAKKRYQEIAKNEKIQVISFHNSLDRITIPIDLAIVATNSNVRRKVIESIISKTTVKYLILEKVVAQAKEDFFKILELCDKNNIKGWVNCHRRTWNIFEKNKKEFC